jgi:hypothetical protein
VTIANEPFGASSSSCPPQAIIPPDPISGAGEASGTGRVWLVGTRIVTSSGSEAVVELRCTGASTCRGRVTLTVKVQAKEGKGRKGSKRADPKTTTIGTATFSIPSGKTATVELKLNTAGKALLSADHSRLSAGLTVLQSFPVPSQTHSEIVQLVRRVSTKARK